MKPWLNHPWRVTVRLLWLGGGLAFTALDYLCRCVFRAKAEMPVARARWLQRASRRLLKIFGTTPEAFGTLPTTGLLVCNHLSYVDILVLSSLTPALFVAKSEVKSWPVFGWFARLAGTVFANREKRTQAGQTADEIEVALRSGVLVILFPEGTSSDGQSVLPFKSSLLAPAARQTHPLHAACINYELADGNVGGDVCYWGEMTLLPHLINLLSKRRVHSYVHFAPLRDGSTDRKELARQLHAEVVRLKAAGAR